MSAVDTRAPAQLECPGERAPALATTDGDELRKRHTHAVGTAQGVAEGELRGGHARTRPAQCGQRAHTEGEMRDPRRRHAHPRRRGRHERGRGRAFTAAHGLRGAGFRRPFAAADPARVCAGAVRARARYFDAAFAGARAGRLERADARWCAHPGGTVVAGTGEADRVARAAHRLFERATARDPFERERPRAFPVGARGDRVQRRRIGERGGVERLRGSTRSCCGRRRRARRWRR